MKKNKKSTNQQKEKKIKQDATPSAVDMINRYGTYEIQPTADTDNMYPAIAQGYNKNIITNDCENPYGEDSAEN